MDDNPRPSKRARTTSSTPEDTTICAQKLSPIPPAQLMLALPSLLAHPPTHRLHTRSLYLSRFALRKALGLGQLELSEECRAWTELAEVGFKIGLDEPGTESEVERAITKALLITQKHPSLRLYRPQLTRLSARLSSHQHNPKLAQSILKRLLTHFLLPSDPPHVVYASHLAYITSLSSSSSSHPINATGPPSPQRQQTFTSNFKARGAIRDLHELATRNGHRSIELLALVLELKDLMHNGVWNDVGPSLSGVEDALGLGLEFRVDAVRVAAAASGADVNVEATGTVTDRSVVSGQGNAAKVDGMSSLEKVLVVHVLLIGVIYYTYIGDNTNAQTRMKKLHDLLDTDVLQAFGPHGIIDVPFPPSSSSSPSPALQIQATHPRLILALGFLISAIAKRDPVGRKPKRRIFAAEGVVVVDKELRKDVPVPVWAGGQDVQAYRARMGRVKADLVCELVGVAVTRSEFDEAEGHLAELVAHLRNCGLFSEYSARVSLHHAHLAHALGRDERASKCYKVAAHLSRRRVKTEVAPEGDDDDDGCEDAWVNTAARAGYLWLRIGVLSRAREAGATAESDSGCGSASRARTRTEEELEWDLLRREGEAVISECEGLGGTLQGIGKVISACLSSGFLQAKTHLRAALALSTGAQDNHLRALVLALVAAQYMHTSSEHAEAMLATAEQLGAGLGAVAKSGGGVGGGVGRETGGGGTGQEQVRKEKTGLGNAHLRLWIGERSLELKRRSGEDAAATKQAGINERLRHAVARVKKRKLVEVD
ncbi:hypothetical protein B0H34DRAFT_791923 [Crassisporium funariophilum]|nr:hypothetical protein B0H34DRAFT_791923 [Crassisporium funariophilum]